MIALVASFFGLDEDIQDLIVEELMAFLPMLTDPITSGMPQTSARKGGAGAAMSLLIVCVVIAVVFLLSKTVRHYVNAWFGDKHKNLHHSPDDVWHKPADGDADVVADADATDVEINVDGDRGEKGAVLRPPREDDDGADVVLARDGARDDADEAASKLAPTPSLEFGGDADVALGPPPPLVADAWTFGEGARVPAVDVDSAGSAVDDVNFLEGMHNYEADDADEAESETVPTLRLEFGDEGDDANDADSEAAPTPRVR